MENVKLELSTLESLVSTRNAITSKLEKGIYKMISSIADSYTNRDDEDIEYLKFIVEDSKGNSFKLSTFDFGNLFVSSDAIISNFKANNEITETSELEISSEFEILKCVDTKHRPDFIYNDFSLYLEQRKSDDEAVKKGAKALLLASGINANYSDVFTQKITLKENIIILKK